MAARTQAFTPRQTMLRRSFEVYHYRDSHLAEVALHHHDFYEVYLFVSGRVQYRIESRSYTLAPGDILLIGPMELHQMRAEHGVPYERRVLWVDRRFLEGLSCPQTSLTRCFDTSAPGHTNLLRPPPAQRAGVEALLDRLGEESAQAQEAYGCDLAAAACLVQLLVTLNRLAAAAPAAAQAEDGAPRVIGEVVRYINAHYHEPLSLDALAARFFISKYHLSHEFRRLVGTSVHRYVVQKRLLIARQMLADGVPPTGVYAACGFGDYAGFYRAFKAEYQTSPKQFSGCANNIKGKD